jgi:aryl-alcohol dehydrogenase-like predicted oxidoreductase
MEVRQLGASGVWVSKLCLGTMNFGGGTDEAEARRIVDEALAAGINFVDTADVYARGVSEEFTGKALVANGHRDDAVLARRVPKLICGHRGATGGGLVSAQHRC